MKTGRGRIYFVFKNQKNKSMPFGQDASKTLAYIYQHYIDLGQIYRHNIEHIFHRLGFLFLEILGTRRGFIPWRALVHLSARVSFVFRGKDAGLYLVP